MLKRTIAAMTGVFLVFVLFSSPINVKSQDSVATKGITVIPPSFELYANPGESATDRLRVRNDSDSTNTYTILVDDFKAVGEEGRVDLIEDPQSDTTYSLAKWVFPEPKSFTLKPKEEKWISFSINVPKNAEPGGRYASILVSSGGDTPSSGSGASVTSRVGSLILLRVTGNVKEDASVESFTTAKKTYRGSPIDFELRVKNNGNNHILPKGTIVISNLFGQKVTEVQLDGRNVLPTAIRKIDTEWRFSSFFFNRYTATLVATYGQQNKPISASTTFYIIPKIAMYVLGALVLFLVLVAMGRKRFKRMLHKLTR